MLIENMTKSDKFLRKRTITLLLLIIVGIYCMLRFEIDVRAIALIPLIIGFITQVFAGIIELIVLIPIIGPILAKILSIPILWVINTASYISSAYIIKKKPSRKEIISHRMIVIALMIGIIIGYILGHLIPTR